MTMAQLDAWQALHAQWKAAFQNMRATQNECTIAFGQSIQGKGFGPTLAQLDAADRSRSDEAALAQKLEGLSNHMDEDLRRRIDEVEAAQS